MLAADPTPKPLHHINALVQGAIQNQEKAAQALNAQLAETARQRAEEEAAAERARLLAMRKEARLRQIGKVRFKFLADKEAREKAPELAEKLLQKVLDSIAQGCGPAAYLNMGRVIMDDDEVTEPVQVPRHDYRDEPDLDTSSLITSNLEDYRYRRFAEAIGAIFHGTDLALVSYEFLIGHNERSETWTQEETQLVYKPESYRPEPLMGLYYHGDPAMPFNNGHVAEVRELRRY